MVFGARVCSAINRTLLIRILDVVPGVAAPNLFEPDIDTVDYHAAHRASVTIGLRAVEMGRPAVCQFSQRLARALPIRLRALRRIDAVEPNAVLPSVRIEQSHRIAIRDGHDRPLELGRSGRLRASNERDNSGKPSNESHADMLGSLPMAKRLESDIIEGN